MDPSDPSWTALSWEMHFAGSKGKGTPPRLKEEVLEIIRTLLDFFCRSRLNHKGTVDDDTKVRLCQALTRSSACS